MLALTAGKRAEEENRDSRATSCRHRGSVRTRFGIARVLALAAIATLACGAVSASAATLSVNTTADELTPKDGQCSLREAVAAANSPGTAGDCGTASNGANTIALGAGDYALTFAPVGGDGNETGDLNVGNAAPLTISGSGSAVTFIDASAIKGLGDRVLSVGNEARVTLRQLTLKIGRAHV